MSANIFTTADGQKSMAYREGTATPWWSGTSEGVANVIGKDDDAETITKKCGFNFTLIAEQAGYMDANGAFTALKGKKIVRRSDSGKAIACVGDKYKFHQPKEILGFFLDYAASFGLKLDTAGVLGDGCRYWAMAKTEVVADLNGGIGNDLAELFCLLATAGDGSMTTLADPKAKRIVCNNTFDMAMRDIAENKERVGRQSHRSNFSADKAAKSLGFNLETSASAFMEMAEQIRSLNGVKVNDRMADGFFRGLLRPELLPEGEMTAESFLFAWDATKDREVRGFKAIRDAYANAPGARPGTARGLWEAATNFIDHGRGEDVDARISSSLFGQGKEIKARAWNNVLALVK